MARSKKIVNRHNTSRLEIIRPEGETHKFRMGISPRAAKILTDQFTNLYTDPISALVRELKSNGDDATAEMPEDERQPVEITTPSMFSPTFVIADHGVGMEPKTIEFIYGQYGESLKGEDMNSIGAHGLGAKVPLAYCEEFLLVSTCNGITTEARCGRDELGNFGEILSVTETGASSGTTITVPLNSNDDIAEFDAAIKRYSHNPGGPALMVNGELVTPDDDFVQIGTVLLDSDENISGRMWVRRDDFNAFALALLANRNRSFNYELVLSGWNYSSQRNSDYYSRNLPRVFVELLPGVVAFPSSRDEILKNERLTSLLERIDAKLGSGAFRTPSPDVVEKVFAVLRSEFEADDVVEFTVRFLNSTTDDFELSEDGKTIKLGTNTYKLDGFTAKDGFNFISQMHKSRNNDLYALAAMDEDGYSRLVSPDLKSCRMEFDKISIVAEALVSAMAAPAAMSLGDFLVSNRLRNGQRENYLTIVENATLDAVVMLNKRRRRIVNSGDGMLRKVAFIDGVVDNDTKDLLRRFGWIVQMFSNEEFIEKVSAIKAVPSSDGAPAGLRFTECTVWEIGTGLDAAKKVITEIEKHYYSSQNSYPCEMKTIKQLIDKDAFIVLSPWGSVSKALKGALNNGVTFDDDAPIYAMGGELFAHEFKALLDYEKVVVHPDYRSRPSKALEDLRAAKSASATVLREELDAVSVEDAELALQYCVSGLSGRSAVLNLLPKDAVTDAGFAAVVNRHRKLHAKRVSSGIFEKKFDGVVNLGREALEQLVSADVLAEMEMVQGVVNEATSYSWSNRNNGVYVGASALQSAFELEPSNPIRKAVLEGVGRAVAMELDRLVIKAREEAMKADTEMDNIEKVA